MDDITFASNCEDSTKAAINQLASHFKLRDLGPTSFLLGIEVKRDRPNRKISLCQKQYIIDMLVRYKMSDCNPISTPMDPGLHLTKEMCPQTKEEVEEMAKNPYLSAVGSLMYLACSTRPDIAYTVGLLARFNSNPGLAHWKAVKHCLRYLKGTIDLKLTYGPSFPGDTGVDFVAYSDADHGGCKDSGRSTSGYITKVGTGSVGWLSKLQSTVALSTTEAEFVAGGETGKEIKWTRQIMGEFGYKLAQATTMYMDNQSAMTVAKNPEHHGRMKHLDLKYYWLRDEVASGSIKVVYIPTADMAADILTKPLAKPQMEKCRKLMGLE